MSDGRTLAIDRLRHMVEAASAIERYTARGRAAFDTDPAIRDAILYQIVVLGEAAKVVAKVDAELAAASSGVEWSVLARMRDHAAHRFWETDHDIVWATATKDVPELRKTLSSAIDRLAGC